MKLRLLALLGIGLGAQVCVGSELDKEKRSVLRVKISDEPSEIDYKTPHPTGEKFFDGYMAVPAQESVSPRIVLEVPKPKSMAMQVIEGLDKVSPATKAKFLKTELEELHAKHVARGASKAGAGVGPVATATLEERDKESKLHHSKRDSLALLMSDLYEGMDTAVPVVPRERISPESPSPRGDIAIAKAARERSNSLALLATALGEAPEKESQEKAKDFLRDLDKYRKDGAQRLTMSGRQVS